MVIVGWVGAGLCSASLANYDVVTGWVSMGILGGGVTGLAAARRKRSQMFLQIFVAMVGWVSAGIIGARIALTGGRQVGSYIGTAIGGRVAPYIVWGVAWAIGGCVTGRPRWCLDVLAMPHGEKPRRARYGYVTTKIPCGLGPIDFS